MHNKAIQARYPCPNDNEHNIFLFGDDIYHCFRCEKKNMLEIRKMVGQIWYFDIHLKN